MKESDIDFDVKPKFMNGLKYVYSEEEYPILKNIYCYYRGVTIYCTVPPIIPFIRTWND